MQLQKNGDTSRQVRNNNYQIILVNAARGRTPGFSNIVMKFGGGNENRESLNSSAKIFSII